MLDQGRKITLPSVFEILDDKLANIKATVGEQSYNSSLSENLAELFENLIVQDINSSK